MTRESTRGEISLPVVFDVLRRRKVYLILTAVTLAAGAAALAFYLPDRYRARVLIAAEPAVAQSHVRDNRDATLVNVQAQLRAVQESLLSRPVLENVIREFSLYGNTGEPADAKALEDVKSRIGVQLESEYHFYVSFEGPDREQTTDVANRLGELFIDRASAVRERLAEDEVGFLDEEIERLQNEMAAQDERARAYRERYASELPERVQSNLQMIEALDKRMADVSEKESRESAELTASRAELAELTAAAAADSREPTAVTEMEEKLEQLEARYTENHPDVVRLRRELTAARAAADEPRPPRAPLSARDAALRAQIDGLEARLAGYREERNELTSRATELRRRADAAAGHEAELQKLTHDNDLQQTQYRALIEKRQEARLASRLEKAHKGLVFTIVEPARLPSAPYSPQRARIIFIGIVAGLGLGVVAAFAAEQADRTFQEPEEVEAFTGLGVLASIPRLKPPKKPDRAVGGNAIEVASRPGSVASEQYRLLAVRLGEQRAGRSLLFGVTSAVGGEGKTMTAVNLAMELARGIEGRVLLVDADLRKPSVGQSLGLSGPRGFGDLLQKPDDDLAGYLVRSGPLHVIPADDSSAFSPGKKRSGRQRRATPPGGRAPARSRPGPVDMVRTLGSVKSQALFERLRREFEIVVLDLPPILPIADSRVLSASIDGLVMVVRARRTTRDLLRRAMSGMESSKLLGAVLNDVDIERSRYAYAYSYYKKHYQAS